MRHLDNHTDAVDFVLSADMDRRNLNTSQRPMVTARLPKLAWGRPSNEKSGIPLFNVKARAARGSVHPDTQRMADAIYDHDDPTLYPVRT